MALGQSMGLSGADLDDAAAEVFAAVYRALPKFQGKSQAGTWVYRIAVRTIGKSKRRSERRETHALPEERVDERAPRPDAQSEEQETNGRIWEAVAELEPRSAAAVELYYRQGWGLERIAEVLERPVGTVKTLLFRARQQLRERLTDEEIGP